MRLSNQEFAELKRNLARYLSRNDVRQMANFQHHGAVSTLAHCQNVATVSFWLNRRLHLRADESALICGAVLHDYYLYDWHDPDPSHRLHGFHHAEVALKNAMEDFRLGEKEQMIIRTHMWPMNITKVPRCREAVIVCATDKYVSLMETLFQRKHVRPICKGEKEHGRSVYERRFLARKRFYEAGKVSVRRTVAGSGDDRTKDA